MSKELLKRALNAIDRAEVYADDEDNAFALCKEIETYLAQPDEPVAWTDSDYEDIMSNKLRESHISVGSYTYRDYPIPLYTSPHDQSARIAELSEEIIVMTAQINALRNYLVAEKAAVDSLEQQLAALQAKREPLSSDQVREVYIAAFPKGPYVFTNDAFVFARMIENAHGINGIGNK